MRRWLGRRSTLFGAIILIVVLSQFSFFAPVRDTLRTAFGAPTNFFHTVGTRFKNAFGVLFAVQDLAKENTSLKEQNISQAAEIAKLSFALGENEQLKRDLQFERQRQDLQLKAANVVNYSPTNLYQSITINKGSNDGIKTGQAVISSGYLVGKINNVSNSTAEVWLLSNRNLLTPVLLSDSQTVGLLKGSIRGLVVENIPLDTKVAKGTPVVTSALEGLYPAGIALGQVEEIISAKEEIFLTLRISTPINPSNLTTVYVVES
ncbi:MAG: rod shape-determining protein MreC [Candidatus Berkelbacteria bacterium]|nr:MAG: rod shape-determining protein MreC [Candidatus Berkelbacteria bacterium]QQG51876.1 MAG: rod shape-determining protein MreC [Candidatus Berkelbacteria bacterium]